MWTFPTLPRTRTGTLVSPATVVPLRSVDLVHEGRKFPPLPPQPPPKGPGVLISLQTQTSALNAATSTRALPPRGRTRVQGSRVLQSTDVGTEPTEVAVGLSRVGLNPPLPEGEQGPRPTEVPLTSGTARRDDVGRTTVTGEVCRTATVVIGLLFICYPSLPFTPIFSSPIYNYVLSFRSVKERGIL